MDVEQIKKRQMIKVFITEAIMVFSIIGLVVFLMMIASGYWISQDFTVERQGLLQYASIPSGADVVIDGEGGWMQKTNNSKMVSAGEHIVTISKEGFDSWSKKVTIEEGLLYRISYPRLFLKERSIEKVKELGNITYTTISPNYENALVLKDNSVFEVAILNSENFELKTVDVAKANDFKNYNLKNILGASWSGDGEKILMNVQASTPQEGDVAEWILVNIKNPEKSARISNSFGLNISYVKFMDNSADNLLILEQGNLRKINVSSQSVSAILAEKVTSMNVFGGTVLFVSNDEHKSVGILTNLDSKPEEIVEVNNDNIFVQESEFYGNRYLSLVDGNIVTLYGEKKSDSMSVKDGFEKILEKEISFTPVDFKIEKDGDFLFMKSGTKIAVLDMESEKISEYEIENEKYGWIDGHMIYTVDNDGALIVYDYDGLNRRELSKNVSSEFGATISDRWLYYVSDGWLVRENLLPK